jgi:hypothetical protein
VFEGVLASITGSATHLDQDYNDMPVIRRSNEAFFRQQRDSGSNTSRTIGRVGGPRRKVFMVKVRVHCSCWQGFVLSMSKSIIFCRSARIKVQADFISREVTHEAYIRMLEKFSDTFDQQLREFLDKLWTDSYRHHPQLSNLCVRLDYNGFYDSRFSSRANTSVSGL